MGDCLSKTKILKNNSPDIIIQDQTSDILYNSIVRINFTVNKEIFIGIGFLIKLNLKNKLRYFLMTCCDIIAEKYINKKMAITLYYLNNDKKFELILDRDQRYIKSYDKPFSLTLVEIIEKDNIIKENILEPDLNYKNGNLYYSDKSCYIVSYNQNNINEKEIKFSSGKITKILNESEFEYSLDTECCNVGSHIFLLNNGLVIGIHKQGNIKKSKNYGIFLGYILDNIEKEEAIKNKNEELNDKKIKLIEEGKNEEENIKEKYLRKKIKDKYSNNKELLKNIKSKYIMIIVLSNLNEKIKLDIFKYNKRIQNIINIKLNNYKFFSGRYIEYETNIKGKEYNGYSDNVRYEGGIIKGKRNGKGKEYGEYGGLIKGNISYDLENLNGLIKKYYYDGTIEFEGEYLNGKRNGKGKEYNEYGNLIFEGEYLDGKRNGKGKEYSSFKLIFEGEYLNGNRWNGKGCEKIFHMFYTLKNGKGYIKKYDSKGEFLNEFEYLDGKRNGKWIEYYSNNKKRFEGEYSNGLLNGEVKMYYYDGKLELEGEYLNGEKNGVIKEYYYKTGALLFEGEYLNGKRNGKGKKYNYDGELEFDGEYLNNYKLKGKEFINNKIEYEGEYLFNKKWNGKGYDKEGNIIYVLNKGNGTVKEYYDGVLKFEGEYLNGRRNGKGKLYFRNKDIEFDGEYLKGKRNGKGKEYDSDDHLIFEGEYLNGKKWNGKEKKYHFTGDLVHEGEYTNGKEYGKEYCGSGKIEFEGEFLNGMRWNGKLTLYDQPLCREIYATGKYVNGIQILNGKDNK